MTTPEVSCPGSLNLSCWACVRPSGRCFFFETSACSGVSFAQLFCVMFMKLLRGNEAHEVRHSITVAVTCFVSATLCAFFVDCRF